MLEKGYFIKSLINRAFTPFIGNLKKQRKDLHQLPGKEDIEKTLPFVRLKGSILDIGKDYRETGFGPNDLSLGQITDISVVYCSAAGGGADMARNVLKKIGKRLYPNMGEEIDDLIEGAFNDKDVKNNFAYGWPVEVTLDTELTHYPGGIGFTRVDYSKKTDKVKLILKNNQRQDNGKAFILELLQNTGLGVVSNIV